MKKIIKMIFLPCFIISMFLFAMDCFAISIQEQWSKQFPNMVASRMSADGDLIGLINKNEFLILNKKGEVIKRGKNQNYGDIAVSTDLYVLSGTKTRVFDYSGKLIWEVPYYSYPYFSPLGNYLMLWEVDERIRMYTKTGKKITEFPIGDEECEFSLDENYVLVPLSGLYKISNGSVSRIVTAHRRLIHFGAEYLKNSKNVAIVCTDENRNESLTMYDPVGKVLWKRDLKKYDFIKCFENNILLMEDRTLKFIDYSGNLKYSITFEKQMFSEFESKELSGKNLFLLKGYDWEGSYLYFINSKGQIVYKHVLPPFSHMYIDKKADFILTISSSNDEKAVLTLKSYRIVY